MSGSGKIDRVKAIQRTRMLLLAACFGISAAAALLGVWFMYDVVAEMQGTIGEYILTIAIVLSITGAAQIFYNEKTIKPIEALLVGDQPAAGDKFSPKNVAILTLALWLAICIAIYFGLAFSSGIGMPFIYFALIVAVSGAFMATLSYLALKRDAIEIPSQEFIADHLVRAPLKLAFFSFGCWVCAGVAIYISARFIIGARSGDALNLLVFASSAGALALPLQYLTFKKALTPVRLLALENTDYIQHIKIRFPLKYKLIMAMAGLVVFGVGFFGVLNLSKSSYMLKKQTGKLLMQAILEKLPENNNLDAAQVGTKIKSVAIAFDAVPIWIDVAGVAQVGSLYPIHRSVANAYAKGDMSQAYKLLNEDILIVTENAKGVRYGLIYAFVEIKPMIAELRNKIVLFIAMTVVFASVLAFLLAFDISEPIKIMREETMQLTRSGDTEWRTNFFTDDENADLGVAFKTMSGEIRKQVNRVNKLLESIGYTVHHLGTSAAELEAISQNQAAGSSEQAAAIQEALTTAGEIAATAKQISENSLTVDNVASETSAACENSNMIVSETIGGIEDVREHVNSVARGTIEMAQHSQRIGGIIDIIEEINEQINLLSVNASIEASGAGEAGHRFTVLAREMRRLSEGTVNATEEIKQIVMSIRKATTTTVMLAEESTKVVDSWAEKVQRLGESFNNISMLVELASRATSEISMSTKQQTSACEQMAEVIAEVKEVADQVVVSSKETEKSMADLSDLTASLKEAVEGNVSEGEIGNA